MRSSDAYLQAVRTVLRLDPVLFPTPATEVTPSPGADPYLQANPENPWGVPLGPRYVDITMDDRPPPWAGLFYVALYKANPKAHSPTPIRFYEETSIVAAITVRATDTPADRYGITRVSRVKEEKPDSRLSINEISERVIQAIHSNATIISEGNKLIEREDGNLLWPLLTPLYYESETVNGPQVVGPGHFRASKPEGESRGETDSGLLLKLTFSGGTRYVPLNDPEPAVPT